MASISHLEFKIKSFLNSRAGRNFYICFIVIAASFASFGLGRLSKENMGAAPVKIMIDGNAASAAALEAYDAAPEIRKQKTEGFVASKKGKKYYAVDCPAGQGLKEENKIYFKTAAEAESAGYSASASC